MTDCLYEKKNSFYYCCCCCFIPCPITSFQTFSDGQKWTFLNAKEPIARDKVSEKKIEKIKKEYYSTLSEMVKKF